MKRSKAEILGEFGPFPDVADIAGVTWDGRQVWFASGEALNALDPQTGEISRRLAVPADAGTAWDGRHLYQLAEDRIERIDPETGEITGTIPAPGGGGSGLAWAEGSLWVGAHRARQIHEVDPETGEVLRTIACSRFVTGVTWVEGELWHGTWEGETSDLRRIDPASGAVEECLELPEGVNVSGLESDGAGRFFCGGGGAGVLRVVRRR